MANRGKKYLEARKNIDSEKNYSIEEAVELIKKVSYTKFDGTVEIHVQLGIDSKKSDQNVRNTVSLPHGTGKDIKVLVFAEGDLADKAKEAGADFAGDDELIDKINNQNWSDFDIAIATPNMMKKVGKLGRVLGPKGLMPSPKAGTVTEDIEKAVKEFKAGKVEVRNDKSGNVHFPAGKVSFDNSQIVENIKSGMDQLSKLKPQTTKGKFFKKVVVAPTMGPGIRLDINEFPVV